MSFRESQLTKEELAAKLAEKRSVIDARLHGIRKEFAEAQEEFIDTVRDRALTAVAIVVATGAVVGWGVSRWRRRRQDNRIAERVVTDVETFYPTRERNGSPSAERPVVVPVQPVAQPRKSSFIGGVLSYVARMLVAQGLVFGIDFITSELLGTDRSSSSGRKPGIGQPPRAGS